MATFQGLFFLVFGIGLSAIAWRSLTHGWLPFGRKGWSERNEIHRDEQPLLYWLLFLMYAGAGIATAVYAVMVLTGKAAPLPVTQRSR